MIIIIMFICAALLKQGERNKNRKDYDTSR